jgi:hypothetical protein
VEGEEADGNRNGGGVGMNGMDWEWDRWKRGNVGGKSNDG